MPQIPGRFAGGPPQPPPGPVAPAAFDATPAESAAEVFGFAELTHFAQVAAKPQRRAISAAAAAPGSAFMPESGGPGQNPLLPRISLTGWNKSPEEIARAMGLEAVAETIAETG